MREIQEKIERTLLSKWEICSVLLTHAAAKDRTLNKYKTAGNEKKTVGSKERHTENTPPPTHTPADLSAQKFH